MLRLRGWGLRPWLDFEFDPSSGRYLKHRLKSEPTSMRGYAGFGQEINVAGLGSVLCSVFVDQGEMVVRIGSAAWNLFEPGLELSHRDALFRCELSILEASGKRTAFRYRRKDWFLVIIDSTYDDLDCELANLPAMLPSWSERNKAELVAEWSAQMAKGAAGAIL